MLELPEATSHNGFPPSDTLSAPEPQPSAMRRLRLGTRASALARWQADWWLAN